VLQIFTTTQALDYIGSRIKTPKGYGSHHLPVALPPQAAAGTGTATSALLLID